MRVALIKIQGLTNDSISVYKKYRPTVIFSNLDELLNSQQLDSIDTLLIGLSKFLDEKFFEKLPNLKYLITPTTALDHIDINYCHKNQITIISLRDAKKKLEVVTGAADHALSLLLAGIRKITYARESVLAGSWERSLEVLGREFSSINVGIIGFGRIGQKVGNYCDALGMTVSFYDSRRVDNPRQFKRLDLSELAEKSDAILLSATASPVNYNFINKDFFTKIKPKDRSLINISRGYLVSESSIIEALNENKLSFYASDVLINEETERFDLTLSSLYNSHHHKKGNILLTPHIGGYTEESCKLTNQIVAELWAKKVKIK